MKRSFWLGALIAPLAASLAYMAVMSLLSDPTPKGDRTLGAMFVALIVFFLPASYIASFFFGWPLIYLLRRFGKLSFWWVVVFAAPLGAIAFVCILYVVVAYFGGIVSWNDIGWNKVLGFLSIGAAFGSATAIAFCLLGGITARPTGGRKSTAPVS